MLLHLKCAITLHTILASDDLMFAPKGLNMGLALSSGSKLLYLHREEKIPDIEEFSYETQVVLIGHVSEQTNDVLPSRGHGEVVTLSVGVPKISLTAVSLYNEMNHDGSLKLVNVSIDVFNLYSASVRGTIMLYSFIESA